MDNYKGMKIAAVPAELGFGFVFNYNDLVSRVVKSEDGYMWTSPTAEASSDLLAKVEAVSAAVLHVAPDLHDTFMIEYDKETLIYALEDIIGIMKDELDGSADNIPILSDMGLDVGGLLANAILLKMA